MSCPKCKAIAVERPRDSILLRYPKPCPECTDTHDWIKIPELSEDLYCSVCRIRKRRIGKNDPCPGTSLQRSQK